MRGEEEVERRGREGRREEEVVEGRRMDKKKKKVLNWGMKLNFFY